MTLRKICKALLFTAAGFAMLIGTLLLAVKLALDRAPRSQAQIKEWVYGQTGYHIAFAAVSPAFRWYGPELTFSGLELRSRDDTRVLARAAVGRVGVDLWQLLQNGKLFALRVELDAPDIVIDRQGPGEFALASEIVLGGERSAPGTLTLNDLPAGRLVIRRGSVSVRHWNPELPRLELREVDFTISRLRDLLAGSLSAGLPPVLGGRGERRRRLVSRVAAALAGILGPARCGRRRIPDHGTWPRYDARAHGARFRGAGRGDPALGRREHPDG
jgi:uncharacterized protein YhdP